ncbi:hypothetical protein GCM10009651_33670 [Microbacterium natoriense]
MCIAGAGGAGGAGGGGGVEPVAGPGAYGSFISVSSIARGHDDDPPHQRNRVSSGWSRREVPMTDAAASDS